MSKKVLVGNAFPLSLVRRAVRITPQQSDAFPRDAKVFSFWGHSNTLPHVNAFLGLDLTPASERVALSLNGDLLPQLLGEVFRECWIISPNYTENFRPRIGEEISAEKISSWTLLKVVWE